MDNGSSLAWLSAPGARPGTIYIKRTTVMTIDGDS
jgi:hypothetical protein